MNLFSIAWLFLSLLVPWVSPAVQGTPVGRARELVSVPALQSWPPESHDSLDASRPAASNDDNAGDVEDDTGSTVGHAILKSPVSVFAPETAGAYRSEFAAISPLRNVVETLPSRAPPSLVLSK